ncbi:hypothetical protein A946_09760 [Methylacidiphilum kamchatkense Kam1]|uniref:Uncharacterized protein n=1 Tax=Methylacidiphilum kamchatkense Kam1 TaxID=1202785 RepID=A0A0C1UMW9_9BACT|nr:hypothetical protein [Methylacidiphilum kamchatkense]KIE57934.1 hypothetical protein A946_09760 [Methylacidiphilum kamchatkense Kam1]QDQ42361.1 hypothetical protein kam1_1132 [Methylacidiphilum kamchatkense Kam1]
MKQKILSGTEAGFPVLRIDSKNYNDCWFDTLSSFLKAHQQTNSFSKETLTLYFSRKAPTLLYDRFLEASGKDGNGDQLSNLPNNPVLRAKWYRESLFESLFKRLERKRLHHPAALQAIWKEAVGTHLATYSVLISINEEKQTAFFRCVSSVISYEITKNPKIIEKIASLTGKPIKFLKLIY